MNLSLIASLDLISERFGKRFTDADTTLLHLHILKSSKSGL
jgi:hypothetical protein